MLGIKYSPSNDFVEETEGMILIRIVTRFNLLKAPIPALVDFDSQN